MADILLSALVSSMVGNLNTSALQELGIALGLRDELDNLGSTLSTIQAVLQDAEEKQWKSEAIRNWLRKLKEGAYDADDVLDEFATEALIQEAEKEKGVKCQVSSFFSLQNRLIFRIKMAHKLKNVRDRLESISMERSKFHLREGDINMEVFDIEIRQTGSVVIESEIYGRGEEKEKIIQVLLTDVSDQDNLAIYAVWGMGGVGKTTLAQLIYNDARVQRHYDMRIWVCVSGDFHIRKLLSKIIDGSSCDLSELDPLQQRLQEKLRGRKFLLVLDDVWNENPEKWNGLKDVLRCGSNGSKVIVTTRSENVALMMTTTLCIHRIGCLSENDSWSLFTRCAFGMGRPKERSELESIGKEIVKKCGGVPLAIKTLGSLMSLKSTESEWLSVKESKIWELTEGENSILSALRLSYYHLRPHLRQCFAFCCVFPKDHKLNRDKLIQLWMANGFIPFKESLEPHDVGIIIFNELVRRSFFQDVVEDSPINITCKMHDLMHDLAQSIMELECVVVGSGKGVKDPKMIRHLAYTKGTAWDVEVCKVRSLRSCIALSNYYGEYKSRQSIFLKQKYLRVCDLTKQPSENAPRSITSLKHLRYLDMSKSFFNVLPESITCLLNLQTLKLDYCYFLHKLPNGMRHMKNLIYLGLRGCDSLTCMSEGMGQLTCLQSLSIFIVGKENGYQISELKGLHLRNELSIKELDNVRNFEEAKNANLIGKQNLHSLSLVWQNKSQCPVPEQVEDVLDGLQPHSNLKVLHIHNYLGSKFPTWMQDSLRDVAEISLIKCERCEHLPPLGKLPILKVLKISGMDSMKYLGNELHGDSASSFQLLEILHLDTMANLEEWQTMDGRENFPRLSTLTFRGCPKLVKMLISASSFPSLEILTLDRMANLEEWRTMDGRENFPCLSALDIRGCPKLVEMPFSPSITSLSISESNAMLIKSVMNLTSLSFLRIESMNESTLLPDGLFQNLTAMKRFELDDCNGLESLPEGLQYLHSLRELSILGCTNILSFPVNGLRGLSSLQRLWIQSCDKFCSLSEGIQYLTSLEDLFIDGCPELMSLPDELQNLTALKTLLIARCPHLQRRCKKDSGEDWHKIARIPNIHIDEDDPPPLQSRNGCKALQKLTFWST